MMKANVALTTVIVLSSILLLGGISLVVRNIDLAIASGDFSNKLQAEIRSNSCLEETMRRVKYQETFTGSLTINFQNGSCTGVVSDFSPGIKEVNITSIIGEFNYSVIKRIDISGDEYVVVL